MADADLTPMESALLIVLMSEAREISNTELAQRFQLTLTGRSRTKLNGLRYVDSHKVGQTFVHQLADEGWVRVQHDLNFASPRARALGAALSALHSNLRDRVLPRVDLSLAEMFSQESAPAATPEADADLQTRIRQAYRSLAKHPGAWVSLTALRPMLGDASTADVNDALRQLEQASDVNIVPESNQKTLTADDRAAAVHIGDQDKHLLAIGV
jgi:trans-aconitate methyltransferase